MYFLNKTFSALVNILFGSSPFFFALFFIRFLRGRFVLIRRDFAVLTFANINERGAVARLILIMASFVNRTLYR